MGLKSIVDNKKLEINKLEMRSGGLNAIVYWYYFFRHSVFHG